MGDSTSDGMFSTMEVECLGACANAPMVQINDAYYEDLTPESMTNIIDSLKRDVMPASGPQSSRKKAEPITGQTTLKKASA